MPKRTVQDCRIDEVEPCNGGTFMVHLKYGFCLNDHGCHTFGADNAREIQSTMKDVKPCCCFECVAAVKAN